jgi:16S rRNA (guanine527-N7)-methyltransferase
MSIEGILEEGAAGFGVSLSREDTEKFARYLEILKAWNERINLTALKDDGEIAVSHFLDSLSAARFVRGAERLLDIGSGAGFPGIPLKIAMPELDVTLVESVHKKTAFMNEVIRELGLTGIRAVWGRAEDESNGVPRGAFPCVISRAVSGVKEVLALSEPYLSPGGSIILMRGRRGEEEWEQAGAEAHRRYRLVEKARFTLPYGGQTRVIFIAEPASR